MTYRYSPAPRLPYGAEEDVQDFRQLRPGLDSPQVVVLFLCAERALHRCRPRPGKFLSDRPDGYATVRETSSSCLPTVPALSVFTEKK